MALLRNYFRVDAVFAYGINSISDAERLVGSLYNESEWIRTHQSKGLKWKANQVYAQDGKALFLLCSPLNYSQPLSIQAIKDLKELGRSYYGIGFHSIHSTDNQEENIIAFDNLLASPKVPGFNLKNIAVNVDLLAADQRSFLDRLAGMDINVRERVVISGGMLMACLGVRSTKDIDLISDFDNGIFRGTHNEFIESYAGIKSYKEIIFGDHGYLWMSYGGRAIRFVPLHILVRAKQARASLRSNIKDVNDLKLLKDLIASL